MFKILSFSKRYYLFFILGLGFILRAISLNQSLWLDEAIGAIAARDYSYLGIITDFIKGDTHPPLYYLTLKFWTSIFGYSEVAMRMLSVLFGVCTIYVVYLVAKELSKKSLPILAALLMAVSPMHVYYSQEVRMYAMNTFLVSLLILWYLRNDFKKYAVTLLFLGMTDYLPLLIFPALWLYALIQKNSFSWWKRFILSHIPLSLFLIFWFPTFLVQSTGSKEALALFPGWGNLIGRAGIKELAFVWIKFLIGRISFDNNFIYSAIIVAVSIFVAFPFINSIKEWKNTTLLLCWFTIPILLAFVGSIFIPGFSYFRMIIVLPAFTLLLAYGLVQIKSQWLTRSVICISMIFSLLYLFNPLYHREDWKGASVYLKQNIQSEEIVLQAFPEPFAGYRWYDTSFAKSYGATGRLGATDSEIYDTVTQVTKNIQGVYYFTYLEDQTDPQNQIKQALSDYGFERLEARSFRGIGSVEYWRHTK